MIIQLLLFACATEPVVPPIVEPVPEPVAAAGSPAIAVGPSLYELPVALVDQNDVAVHLDVHRGHPVIVSMIYTSCTTACPMTVQRVQAIEAALPPAVLADTRVLLVSLDPKRDDAQALREMLERHGADGTRWTLARADEDGVRDVAAVLGIKYRTGADGMVDHSTILTVLDPEGRVVARQTGLADPIEGLVQAIAEFTAPS